MSKTKKIESVYLGRESLIDVVLSVLSKEACYTAFVQSVVKKTEDSRVSAENE